jgi:hypothetical protein
MPLIFTRASAVLPTAVSTISPETSDVIVRVDPLCNVSKLPEFPEVVEDPIRGNPLEDPL